MQAPRTDVHRTSFGIALSERVLRLLGIEQKIMPNMTPVPLGELRRDGNYEPGSRYSLQSLEFKYLLFTQGEDELYDLTADPREMNNLAGETEHRETEERPPVPEVRA